MAICRNPNCSKENPDNITYCKYCGRRLKELKKNNKKPLLILAGAGLLIVVVIFTKFLFDLGSSKQTNPNNGKITQNNGAVTNVNNGYAFVFVKGQGNAKDIYFNNNGNILRVTNSNTQNLYPTMSPDGSKIAFERKEGTVSNIYVINKDGTGEKKLAEGHGPTWSSDGTKIIFYNKSTKSISNILYSIKSDGTGLAEMTKKEDSYYMGRYSPDGSKIVLAKYSIEGWGIYLYGPDLSGIKVLSLGQKQEGEPAWSVDGSKVTFVSSRDGNPEIYMVDLNKNVTRLTNNPANDYSPYFTPDGKVIFTRDEAGTSNLYIVGADGKNETILLKDAAFGAIGK